jgi:hypothetical protein
VYPPCLLCDPVRPLGSKARAASTISIIIEINANGPALGVREHVYIRDKLHAAAESYSIHFLINEWQTAH